VAKPEPPPLWQNRLQASPMSDSTFLTRVVLKSYKSIPHGDVRLGPLSFIVGPNGAGKSNFLDAIRFTADALRTSLEHAVRSRGGFSEIVHQSTRHPSSFGMRLEFTLGPDRQGYYAYCIGLAEDGGFRVRREECWVCGSPGSSTGTSFKIKDGHLVAADVRLAPAAFSDRMYLVNASGLAEFRPVYDAFSRMGFYNLSPALMRGSNAKDTGDLLAREGSNLASVLAKLSLRSPELKSRIEEYLARIVPGVTEIDANPAGTTGESLTIHKRLKGSIYPWRFSAVNMSDGTLRALAILVALFQATDEDGAKIPLIGIEEPELGLHPAAMGILREAIREASRTTQVLVTSHSPELLEDSTATETILAVLADDGLTRIGAIETASADLFGQSSAA
jgi:predicted ATPase